VTPGLIAVGVVVIVLKFITTLQLHASIDDEIPTRTVKGE
jgi:hypothetical protein